MAVVVGLKATVGIAVGVCCTEFDDEKNKRKGDDELPVVWFFVGGTRGNFDATESPRPVISDDVQSQHSNW
jgi:hypothetical protein